MIFPSILLLVLFVIQLIGVPIRPKPPSEAELREDLGEEYAAFQRLRAKEIVRMLKENINATDDVKKEIIRKALEKARDHEPVHEPGTGDQFHETWRDEDDMDDDSYSPESFFYTHDINGDGYLDAHEIAAIIQHELDKTYNDSHSEMDMEYRDLEMKRMFHHTMKAGDKNRDGRLSLAEFMQASSDTDDGWTPLEDIAKDINITSDIHDPYVVEQVKHGLQEHPDDDDYERIMHQVSGMEANPGKIGIGENAHFLNRHEHGGAAHD